ncbi:MAG: hypothetical protein LH606_03005 [Cytophagaceae bacterium]|nr:hypothetical protein [Cytophagaceae bacterium]
MLINFDQQPDHARVWVYQTNRPLTGAEAVFIQKNLEAQTTNWGAHGQPLVGSVRVLHNRFVVVAVDETQSLPSGCSIDASTRWLKDLGAEMNLDFFDRSVAYLDGNDVKTLNLNELKIAVVEGRLTPETSVFNNLVPTIGTFRQGWRIKAADSWLKKYFKAQNVSVNG